MRITELKLGETDEHGLQAFPAAAERPLNRYMAVQSISCLRWFESPGIKLANLLCLCFWESTFRMHPIACALRRDNQGLSLLTAQHQGVFPQEENIMGLDQAEMTTGNCCLGDLICTVRHPCADNHTPFCFLRPDHLCLPLYIGTRQRHSLWAWYPHIWGM